MVLGPGCDRLPDSIRQMLPLMPAPAADQLCPTLLNGVLGTCDLTAMVEYGLATALPEMTMPRVCNPAAQVGGKEARTCAAPTKRCPSGQSAAPHMQHARWGDAVNEELPPLPPCMCLCLIVLSLLVLLLLLLLSPSKQVAPPPGSAPAPLPDRRPLPASSFADVASVYAAEGATYSW